MTNYVFLIGCIVASILTVGLIIVGVLEIQKGQPKSPKTHTALGIVSLVLAVLVFFGGVFGLYKANQKYMTQQYRKNPLYYQDKAGNWYKRIPSGSDKDGNVIFLIPMDPQ